MCSRPTRVDSGHSLSICAWAPRFRAEKGGKAFSLKESPAWKSSVTDLTYPLGLTESNEQDRPTLVHLQSLFSLSVFCPCLGHKSEQNAAMKRASSLCFVGFRCMGLYRV